MPHGDVYEARLIPIKQLNCFVILPGFFRTARLSPATRYVRLLEGRRWERYLGRATGLFGASKLVITYWRPDYEVSPQKEFRAFLDLRREGWTDRLATFSLALTAVLDGTALMSNPHDLAKAPLVKAAEALWEVSGIRVSLGISAVALALSLLRAIAASRTRWRQARRWLRAAEQRIYRLPARLD